jgi:hypothetical protein
VLGADLSLGSLRDFLEKIPLTPNGAIVVLDRKNRILAHHSTSPAYGLKDVAVLMPVSTTGSPPLAVLEDWKGGSGGTQTRIVDVGGDPFVFAYHAYAAAPGMELRIAAFAPMRDFSGPIVEARNQVILVTTVFLLFIIPLAVIGARRVGAPSRSSPGTPSASRISIFPARSGSCPPSCTKSSPWARPTRS